MKNKFLAGLLTLLLAFTLGVCLPAQAEKLPEPAIQQGGDDAAGNDTAGCDYQDVIGMDVDYVRHMKRFAKKTLRILRPNQPATMDYSADRVNLHIDDNGKVIQVTCG